MKIGNTQNRNIRWRGWRAARTVALIALTSQIAACGRDRQAFVGEWTADRRQQSQLLDRMEREFGFLTLHADGKCELKLAENLVGSFTGTSFNSTVAMESAGTWRLVKDGIELDVAVTKWIELIRTTELPVEKHVQSLKLRFQLSEDGSLSLIIDEIGLGTSKIELSEPLPFHKNKTPE